MKAPRWVGWALGELSDAIGHYRTLSDAIGHFQRVDERDHTGSTLGHSRREHSRSYRTGTLGAIGRYRTGTMLVHSRSSRSSRSTIGVLSDSVGGHEATTTMLASCQDALREHESTRGCEYTPPELIVFEQKHPTRAASTWRLVPPSHRSMKNQSTLVAYSHDHPPQS